MMTEETNADHGLRRYTLALAALVLTCTALYFGRELFILLFTSGLFAFLLLPMCKGLEKWGWPVWLSAIVCCLLIIAVVAGLIWFLGWEYSHFGRDLPQLKESLNAKVASVQRYVSARFDLTRREQDAWTEKQITSITEDGGSIAMGVFSATGTVLATVVLIPIFTFLLLVLKKKFHTFFEQLGGDHGGAVLKVVVRSAELSRKYLRGVLTVMVILSILNSVGFLLLGLKYAILLGVTAAMLNVVPYIGPWVGSILPIVIALITKDSIGYAVGALGVILFTQFIDNNFITPKVVGSSVSINPLASIVALFAGGMLWGVAGLILAIPITGMLKVVCDEVPGLKPWGYLLGEERTYPEARRLRLPFIPKPRKPPAGADMPGGKTGASAPRPAIRPKVTTGARRVDPCQKWGENTPSFRVWITATQCRDFMIPSRPV